MKKILLLLYLVMPCLLALGCATAPTVSTKVQTRQEAAKGYYISRAADFEGKGDLVQAAKEYRLALAVDPQDAQARQALDRIEALLKEQAKRRFEEGMRLRENGNYSQARQEFLAALRLDPDYTEAYRMLTDKSHVVKKPFVIHEVKSGETISKIAQQYYGDHRKYKVIASFNALDDSAMLKAGQKLRIPIEEGAPPLRIEASTHHETFEFSEPWDEEFFAFGDTKDAAADRPQPEKKKEEEPDQVSVYRDYGLELFKQQRYEEAAAELDKVLAALPDDKVAREYAYKAHLENALRLMEERDYLAARDKFKLSLHYNSDCAKCHNYIKQCEDTFKETHYRSGMRLFQEQRVQEALKEWELVSSLDPHYKRTPQLIDRARTILKKLEEIKKPHP